jgi:hypothetical protein
MRNWIAGVAVFAFVSVLLLSSGHAAASPALPAADCDPHCIEHVVIVTLENAKLSDVLTKGPYLAYLWNEYGQATN